VAVGVTALIVVIGVMNGLQNDLREKILGTNPHIWLTSFGDAMRVDDWPAVLARVQQVPGVTAAAPFVHSETMLQNRAGHVEGVILRGIDPHTAGPPITDVVRQIRADSLNLDATRSGLPPVLVGRGLAERFGLYPGDVVNVLSPQASQLSPMGGYIPKIRKFEVSGTFHTGMYEYDNKFMYTPLQAAQDLAGLGTAATGIEIRVPDAMKADQVGRQIERALGFPYRAEDWKTMNSSLFEALKLEKFAMGIILLLIVIVAAFNIISTLIMVVTDKTREIGILKAIGMTRPQVLRVFLLQGLVIGVVGSTLGLIGGLGLSWILDRYQLIKIPGDVYFIDRLPVALEPRDVALIVILSILISFVATLYPARQAATLLPVDAIRND
ncbi:MAG: ABC transporter permease, partial [Gemmatimonadota bacterium]|nr:ABC transporter permease [Gemmatimonadota bacterium]